MALIGLATATVVAMILAVRSNTRTNKAAVLGMWGVLAAWDMGVSL